MEVLEGLTTDNVYMMEDLGKRRHWTWWDPLPETKRGRKGILVLTDHCTRWQDALTILTTNAPVVATALDDRVFCYFRTV